MKKSILASSLSVAFLLSGCSRERLAPPPPGVHLRAEPAITYYLDKKASDALELAARESFQLWSDATKFKFTYGGKAAARIARDGRNQVVFLGRWPEELSIGEPYWTQAYLDASGKIVEADILLNAQAYSFTTKREARVGSLYIEEVLSTAIGRSLGIGLGSSPGEGRRANPLAAATEDAFVLGIDPAEMAAYLSLYAVEQTP